MTTPYPLHLLLASNHANLMALNAIAQGMLNAVERVAVLNIETARAAAEYAASGLRMLHGGDRDTMISPQGGGPRSPTTATVIQFRRKAA